MYNISVNSKNTKLCDHKGIQFEPRTSDSASMFLGINSYSGLYILWQNNKPIGHIDCMGPDLNPGPSTYSYYKMRNWVTQQVHTSYYSQLGYIGYTQYTIQIYRGGVGLQPPPLLKI